jgi:hypothetical protein
MRMDEYDNMDFFFVFLILDEYQREFVFFWMRKEQARKEHN